MLRRLVVISGAIALASCMDSTGPLETTAGLRPQSQIIDARNGGARGFYFLPPLAPVSAYEGTFDATRTPVVEVCALSGTVCGDPIARFTTGAGTGSEVIRASVVDQHYIVQLRAGRWGLSPGTTYRIRVLDGSIELGHAEIVVLKNGSEAKSLPAGTTGLVAGATIPIKFRIEVRTGGAPARLEVHPGTFLLPGAGASLPLQVTAYDANGQQVEPGPVSWQSSKPSVVGVSSAGVATAILGTGSTQITAVAGGLTSAPALGMVAQPVSGALLITDENVVTTSPASMVAGARLQMAVNAASATANVIVPVDPTAPYKPGWLYKVLLNGVTPVPGQILISQGEAAIGGRVVSVTPVGADVEVTLALVAIADMLPGLSVEESFQLEEIPIEIPAEILADYSVTRSTGGRMSFRSRAPRSFSFASGLGKPVSQASLLDSESEIDIGPFACKVTTSGTPVSPNVTNSSFHIDPDLTFDLNYSPTNGLQRLVVRGGIDAGVTVTPVFPLVVEEKIACEVQLATIHLPVGGPLALFVGGEVPVGVGFEIGGKLTAANLGVEASMIAGATMLLGIDCSAGCGPVGNVTGSASGSFRPIIPDIAAEIRIELTATGFAWAKLEVGNPFIESLRFEAFEGKAGLKQVALLGSPKGQVSDPAFASSFKFSFDIEAATGSGLNKLGELLGINMSAMKVEHSELLAQSPRAPTFTITPGNVDAMTATYAGEKAKFELTLDPVTYMGGYAVDSILLFRKKAGTAGDFILEKVPGGCGQLSAASGQSSFSCETALPETWAGEQTIHAFVRPRIFGVAIPLLFELREDAKATITVDTSAITVTPSSVSVASGATVQYSATVTGLGSNTVTWSAAGGAITSGGLYTAGTTAGTYQVVATSTADPTITATATVTVSAPAPPPPPSSATVSVIRDSVMVLAGDRNFFSAVVTPSPANAVTWTATGGTITAQSPTSGGLYTAGQAPGTFQVTATSIDSPGSTGTAKVIIVAAASGLYTGTRCMVPQGGEESCSDVSVSISAPLTVNGKVYVGFNWAPPGSNYSSCSRLARLVSGTGSATLVGTQASVCTNVSNIGPEINVEEGWVGTFSGSLTTGQLTITETEPESVTTFVVSKVVF